MKRPCWMCLVYCAALIVWMWSVDVAAQAIPDPSALQPPASGPRTESGIWALSNRPWYDPLAAESRAAQMVVLGLAWGDDFQYMLEPGSRRLWDISLGKEFPIIGWESSAYGDRQPPPGTWGAGLWLPVSFHMASDHKDPSSPIINTDYRFGGIVKIVYAFPYTSSDPRSARLPVATRLAGKLHFGHESTHLGDEFTIHAIQRYGSSFERINVSYEFLEYGTSLDLDNLVQWHAENPSDDRHWRLIVRYGGQVALNSDGFYSDHLLDDSRLVLPSKRNFEPLYFGAELAPTRGGDLLPRPFRNWLPFVSIDTRLRTIYDYHKASAEDEEDAAWSTGIVLGLRHMPSRAESGAGRGIPDLIVKAYRGVNPHGQFRNDASFWSVGFGLYVQF